MLVEFKLDYPFKAPLVSGLLNVVYPGVAGDGREKQETKKLIE